MNYNKDCRIGELRDFKYHLSEVQNFLKQLKLNCLKDKKPHLNKIFRFFYIEVI